MNEPIIREKAFAFVPIYNDYDEDAISYHCQNCAKTNCIPFPCYVCMRVTYCSTSCMEQHKKIHKFECPGYQKSNIWMKIGIAHLAFRNFIVGFADTVEKIDDTKSNPKKLLSTLTSIDDKNFCYGNVLRLITNFDKMEPDDILRYALTSVMLTIYLGIHSMIFVINIVLLLVLYIYNSFQTIVQIFLQICQKIALKS